MPDPSVSQFDRSPLREHERALIRAAETQIWTRDLREALAECVRLRGCGVGRYEGPDSLVAMLEEVARSERSAEGSTPAPGSVGAEPEHTPRGLSGDSTEP